MDSSAGCRCREAPCNYFLFAPIGAVAVSAAACQCQAAYAVAEESRLQQGGQTIMSSYAAAGHTAGARTALLIGTSQADQRPVSVVARDRQIRHSAPVCLWSCSVKVNLASFSLRSIMLVSMALSISIVGKYLWRVSLRAAWSASSKSFVRMSCGIAAYLVRSCNAVTGRTVAVIGCVASVILSSVSSPGSLAHARSQPLLLRSRVSCFGTWSNSLWCYRTMTPLQLLLSQLLCPRSNSTTIILQVAFKRVSSGLKYSSPSCQPPLRPSFGWACGYEA